MLQATLSSPYPPGSASKSPLRFDLEVIEKVDQIRTTFSSLGAIFPGYTALPGRFGTSLSEESSRVEMTDCHGLDEWLRLGWGPWRRQGHIGISEEEKTRRG